MTTVPRSTAHEDHRLMLLREPETQHGRALRFASFTGITVSLALMALVGLCRFPAAVPPLDSGGVFPRLNWTPDTDLWVTAVLWAAMIAGTAGLGAGLKAVRHGWRPRPHRLVAGGMLAVAVLVAAPPMGTTDTMDYVVYGRMAQLGYNPHVMTPREFRATGDPVGALTPQPWEDIPSVYGPLATATEWAAAVMPGNTAAATVFWLKTWNALAFLAAALALDRLAGGDRARRTRVHLLWTLNPLMLWALIGGGHVDGLAVGLAVAALAVSGPAAWRSGTAGMLLGAAAAVKAPYVLVGLGMAWAVRRSSRALTALGAGTAGVLAAAYAVAGDEGIAALTQRSRSPSSNTPWQLLTLLAGPLPPWLSWASLTLAAAVAVLLLRARPGGPAWLRPALAICLAWVITTPVYYPWYEALVFPLVALCPATRLDWVQLARALVATIGCLPGITFRFGGAWFRSAMAHGPVPYLVPGMLLGLVLALIGMVLLAPQAGAPGALATVPTPAGGWPGTLPAAFSRLRFQTLGRNRAAAERADSRRGDGDQPT
jgi:hypothetical protein